MIHLYIYISIFFFRFFSIIGYYKIFTIDPYAIHCFPGSSDSKASAYNAGDLGSIPGLGRSPGEGNGNPLQYSCLENPMDGGAWWATLVHGVTKSRTRLRDFTSLHSIPLYSCMHLYIYTHTHTHTHTHTQTHSYIHTYHIFIHTPCQWAFMLLPCLGYCK